jgi:ATP-dependent protease ClpP protease subunit
VFLAGKERLMFENAFLASDKTNQKTNDRSRQEKEITLTQLQREDERYSRIILENSRMTKRQLDKFEREEKQINAQEAVKLDLAHKIIRNI